jgi:hypothetical protein
MRSSSLSAMKSRLTPNLKYVVRDRAHGSKRLLSRTWGADKYLNEVTQRFVRSRRSMARLIHFSPELRSKFVLYCRATFGVVRKTCKNMRAAPQRYECLQKPFGRSVLFVHACIKLAAWCNTVRDDESSAISKEFLEYIDDEAALQASMQADASDQIMIITRLVDNEDTDPAILPREISACLDALEHLFGEQRKCLEAFGYTKAMMQILSKPMVWAVGGGVRSLGSDAGPSAEVINRCFGRMRSWICLLRATTAVEFPSFEVSHA